MYIFASSHCNPFEDRVPIDEIYVYPFFKCVAETWQHERVPSHLPPTALPPDLRLPSEGYKSEKFNGFQLFPTVSCKPAWLVGTRSYFGGTSTARRTTGQWLQNSKRMASSAPLRRSEEGWNPQPSIQLCFQFRPARETDHHLWTCLLATQAAGDTCPGCQEAATGDKPQ